MLDTHTPWPVQPWPRYTNTSELNLRLRVDKGAPNITVQVPSSSRCPLPASSMKLEGHDRVWNSRSELLLLACHVKQCLGRACTCGLKEHNGSLKGGSRSFANR